MEAQTEHPHVTSDLESNVLRPLERIPTYLQPSMPLRERLHHFTFAWYTVTMSTSGIALVLAMSPHRFTGLDIIGLIIFLLDLLLFFFITIAIIFRFILHQHTFGKAFTHPREALFISTFFLSIAAILVNMQLYGELFLAESAKGGMTRFLGGAFWAYLTLTFIVSALQYHLLFTVREDRRLTINSMTPSWILPIFPIMLTGTLAGVFSKAQPVHQAASMLYAGLAAQGLGLLISVFMYSTYLSRLMAFGLPIQRPGMFIAVGPPSFTCAALVAMASDTPRILTYLSSSEVSILAGLDDPMMLAASVRIAAVNGSVFLWGLSFWFFTLAMAAVLTGMPDRRFHLSWWSFVFPNVGFTIASIRIGHAVSSGGILWMATVMTLSLFLAWAFIAFRCVRAVYKREIVWPGHDEDSN
ncbi:c4-dicarboxylate transporter malic acid transporter [Fusarium beomiforme]|uniref:C4-dicarboxylate transporter malic acid transporter n=1 Tax=Fusarium beomiforme TaxID=44412 RepID=A0A9P5A5W7_9HYPO|nr:c4-dicarboxylate transporter malic acid transporter [Fusarium beomiforme]